MVQRRRHFHPAAHRRLARLELHLRAAPPEALHRGQPVAVVGAVIVEGGAVVGGGEGADGAVAFGPGGAVVGFEEAGFAAFVGWGRVADVVVVGVVFVDGDGVVVVEFCGYG